MTHSVSCLPIVIEHVTLIFASSYPRLIKIGEQQHFRQAARAKRTSPYRSYIFANHERLILSSRNRILTRVTPGTTTPVSHPRMFGSLEATSYIQRRAPPSGKSK